MGVVIIPPAGPAGGGGAVDTVNGLTGDVVLTKSSFGLGNVDNTSDANKPISSATQTALDLKANLASPTFTGTVSGITKAMVGLGNVDNTSDASKPVSTATQTALNLKANLASPTFTGTVSGITKAMVGLSNVDNTADVDKPLSSAATTALAGKVATSTTVAGKALSGNITLVPSDVGVSSASTTVAGLVELATTTETTTGTDSVRAVTPIGLAAALAGKAQIVGDALTVSGRIIVSTSATPSGLQAGDLVVVVPA